jgi:hypothetical protein
MPPLSHGNLSNGVLHVHGNVGKRVIIIRIDGCKVSRALRFPGTPTANDSFIQYISRRPGCFASAALHVQPAYIAYIMCTAAIVCRQIGCEIWFEVGALRYIERLPATAVVRIIPHFRDPEHKQQYRL